MLLAEIALSCERCGEGWSWNKRRKSIGEATALKKGVGAATELEKKRQQDTGYTAGEDGSVAGWRKVLVQERSTSDFTFINLVAKT